jgi:hypothetical protein
LLTFLGKTPKKTVGAAPPAAVAPKSGIKTHGFFVKKASPVTKSEGGPGAPLGDKKEKKENAEPKDAFNALKSAARAPKASAKADEPSRPASAPAPARAAAAPSPHSQASSSSSSGKGGKSSKPVEPGAFFLPPDEQRKLKLALQRAEEESKNDAKLAADMAKVTTTTHPHHPLPYPSHICVTLVSGSTSCAASGTPTDPSSRYIAHHPP